MALPTGPSSPWSESEDLPTNLLQTSSDFELYQEEDDFVLSVEMPGYDIDEISVSWDDGILNIAAEHEDESRGEYRTYHRRFRFPKDVDEDGISAEYTNGILEVRLPVMVDTETQGTQIEIKA